MKSWREADWLNHQTTSSIRFVIGFIKSHSRLGHPTVAIDWDVRLRRAVRRYSWWSFLSWWSKMYVRLPIPRAVSMIAQQFRRLTIDANATLLWCEKRTNAFFCRFSHQKTTWFVSICYGRMLWLHLTALLLEHPTLFKCSCLFSRLFQQWKVWVSFCLFFYFRGASNADWNRKAIPTTWWPRFVDIFV